MGWMIQYTRDRQITGCKKTGKRLIVLCLAVWIWGSPSSSRRAACWLRHMQNEDEMRSLLLSYITIEVHTWQWVPWILQTMPISHNWLNFSQSLYKEATFYWEWCGGTRGDSLLSVCCWCFYILPLEWCCHPKVDISLNSDVPRTGPVHSVCSRIGIKTEPPCLKRT